MSALASHSQKTALSISPIVQKSSVSSDCQGTNYWPPFKAFYCFAHSACPAPFPTTPFCKSFSAPVPSVCPLSPTFPHLHLSRYQPSFKSQLKSSLLANAFMPFQPEGSPSPLNVHVSFADTVTALYSSPLNNTDLNCADDSYVGLLTCRFFTVKYHKYIFLFFMIFFKIFSIAYSTEKNTVCNQYHI